MKRLLTAAVVTATASVAAMASAAPPPGGHLTDQPSMISGVAPGVTATPLITVGEQVGSYRFESLPDGIALRQKHANTVEVFVNHETSLVPFPVFTPTEFRDYTNALVSKLTLDKHSGAVVAGISVIPSTANFQRFCSSFLAGKSHGFERELLLTNEEATDWVNLTGQSFPATRGAPGTEQAGRVVALDTESGEYRAIYGMGRHNHENSVALPRYGHPVVLSGDDTFNAPASQLYLYRARNAAEVWDDAGELLAFVSDVPAVNDYGDLTVGGAVSGRFIPVPRGVATGKNADGTDTLVGTKGPQELLEDWSNTNNVFQFIRVEDIAYDRRHPNVVYLADTGEERAIPDGSGRLKRRSGSTAEPAGLYPNGRIFKLVLDPKDETRVLSLSILIDGDALGVASKGNLSLIHQPDNLETTERSLLIQEDPGSYNQYAVGTGTTARIWRYDFRTGALEVVAKVDQSSDPATPKARLGSWESSGIVDASNAFGPGAFLVDVQAPSISLDRVEGPDLAGAGGGGPDSRPDWVLEREGGQLALLRIPGA